MNFLIDTNVLVRIQDVADTRHKEAIAAIELLKKDGHDCYIVPQILYEFWVVATRPLENNGLGMDSLRAQQAVNEWMSLFRLKLDERGLFAKWMNLVSAHHVRGKVSHDARLVAAMEKHSIVALLTFNVGDFSRFANIKVFSPPDVLKGF